MTQLPIGFACLDNLSLIAVSGDDAAQFLHNQLSQNFLTLKSQNATLALYCSAQGRVLASIIALTPQPQQYWLIIDNSISQTIIKRLTMFVLRSQVTFNDISQQYQFYGRIKTELTESPIWSASANTQGYIVNLAPVAQQGRELWIVAKDQLKNTPLSPTIDLSAWHYSQILSAITNIDHNSTNKYIPQMLNYESIGAINFKKGCYPGQEVIARSQFRGSIKRRAFVAVADKEIPVNADVFLSSNAELICGSVVQTANYQQQFAAIICLQLTSLEKLHQKQSYLFVHSTDQEQIKLNILDLPYQLLTDI